MRFGAPRASVAYKTRRPEPDEPAVGRRPSVTLPPKA